VIVEAPVAGGWFAVDGSVVDEHLYCMAVFCFAILHEVLDDVSSQSCARGMGPIRAGERKQRTGGGPGRGFRPTAEGRSLYDIEIYAALLGANGCWRQESGAGEGGWQFPG
jgi:hypothetical protein